jgi:hypothetical protein
MSLLVCVHTCHRASSCMFRDLNIEDIRGDGEINSEVILKEVHELYKKNILNRSEQTPSINLACANANKANYAVFAPNVWKLLPLVRIVPLDAPKPRNEDGSLIVISYTNEKTELETLFKNSEEDVTPEDMETKITKAVWLALFTELSERLANNGVVVLDATFYNQGTFELRNKAVLLDMFTESVIVGICHLYTNLPGHMSLDAYNKYCYEDVGRQWVDVKTLIVDDRAEHTEQEWKDYAMVYACQYDIDEYLFQDALEYGQTLSDERVKNNANLTALRELSRLLTTSYTNTVIGKTNIMAYTIASNMFESHRTQVDNDTDDDEIEFDEEEETIAYNNVGNPMIGVPAITHPRTNRQILFTPEEGGYTYLFDKVHFYLKDLPLFAEDHSMDQSVLTAALVKALAARDLDKDTKAHVADTITHAIHVVYTKMQQHDKVKQMFDTMKNLSDAMDQEYDTSHLQYTLLYALGKTEWDQAIRPALTWPLLLAILTFLDIEYHGGLEKYDDLEQSINATIADNYMSYGYSRNDLDLFFTRDELSVDSKFSHLFPAITDENYVYVYTCDRNTDIFNHVYKLCYDSVNTNLDRWIYTADDVHENIPFRPDDLPTAGCMHTAAPMAGKRKAQAADAPKPSAKKPRQQKEDAATETRKRSSSAAHTDPPVKGKKPRKETNTQRSMKEKLKNMLGSFWFNNATNNIMQTHEKNEFVWEIQVESIDDVPEEKAAPTILPRFDSYWFRATRNVNNATGETTLLSGTRSMNILENSFGGIENEDVTESDLAYEPTAATLNVVFDDDNSNAVTVLTIEKDPNNTLSRTYTSSQHGTFTCMFKPPPPMPEDAGIQPIDISASTPDGNQTENSVEKTLTNDPAKHAETQPQATTKRKKQQPMSSDKLKNVANTDSKATTASKQANPSKKDVGTTDTDTRKPKLKKTPTPVAPVGESDVEDYDPNDDPTTNEQPKSKGKKRQPKATTASTRIPVAPVVASNAEEDSDDEILSRILPTTKDKKRQPKATTASKKAKPSKKNTRTTESATPKLKKKRTPVAPVVASNAEEDSDDEILSRILPTTKGKKKQPEATTASKKAKPSKKDTRTTESATPKLKKTRPPVTTVVSSDTDDDDIAIATSKTNKSTRNRAVSEQQMEEDDGAPLVVSNQKKKSQKSRRGNHSTKVGLDDTNDTEEEGFQDAVSHAVNAPHIEVLHYKRTDVKPPYLLHIVAQGDETDFDGIVIELTKADATEQLRLGYTSPDGVSTFSSDDDKHTFLYKPVHNAGDADDTTNDVYGFYEIISDDQSHVYTPYGNANVAEEPDLFDVMPVIESTDYVMDGIASSTRLSVVAQHPEGATPYIVIEKITDETTTSIQLGYRKEDSRTVQLFTFMSADNTHHFQYALSHDDDDGDNTDNDFYAFYEQLADNQENEYVPFVHIENTVTNHFVQTLKDVNTTWTSTNIETEPRDMAKQVFDQTYHPKTSPDKSVIYSLSFRPSTQDPNILKRIVAVMTTLKLKTRFYLGEQLTQDVLPEKLEITYNGDDGIDYLFGVKVQFSDDAGIQSDIVHEINNVVHGKEPNTYTIGFSDPLQDRPLTEAGVRGATYMTIQRMVRHGRSITINDIDDDDYEPPQAAAEESAVEETAAEEPAAEVPVADPSPSADEPPQADAEESAVEEPVADPSPSADEPPQATAEEPAAEEPVADPSPSADEPPQAAAEEPAAEEPVADPSPSADEPTVKEVVLDGDWFTGVYQATDIALRVIITENDTLNIITSGESQDIPSSQWIIPMDDHAAANTLVLYESRGVTQQHRPRVNDHVAVLNEPTSVLDAFKQHVTYYLSLYGEHNDTENRLLELGSRYERGTAADEHEDSMAFPQYDDVRFFHTYAEAIACRTALQTAIQSMETSTGHTYNDFSKLEKNVVRITMKKNGYSLATLGMTALYFLEHPGRPFRQFENVIFDVLRGKRVDKTAIVNEFVSSTGRLLPWRGATHPFVKSYFEYQVPNDN